MPDKVMLSLPSQIVQKWEKGGIPLDEGSVKAASTELEKVVATLQSDIINMTGETFTNITDRVAAAEIKKIVAADYHVKVYRQLYDIERLDKFRYGFGRILCYFCILVIFQHCMQRIRTGPAISTVCPREFGARGEAESAEANDDDRECGQRGIVEGVDVGSGREGNGQVAGHGK